MNDFKITVPRHSLKVLLACASNDPKRTRLKEFVLWSANELFSTDGFKAFRMAAKLPDGTYGYEMTAGGVKATVEATGCPDMVLSIAGIKAAMKKGRKADVEIDLAAIRVDETDIPLIQRYPDVKFIWCSQPPNLTIMPSFKSMQAIDRHILSLRNMDSVAFWADLENHRMIFTHGIENRYLDPIEGDLDKGKDHFVTLAGKEQAAIVFDTDQIAILNEFQWTAIDLYGHEQFAVFKNQSTGSKLMIAPMLLREDALAHLDSKIRQLFPEYKIPKRYRGSL
jgi:hypothetical protein